MKKFIYLLWLLFPLSAAAQNTITIDLATNTVSQAPANLDRSVAINFAFQSCETLGEFNTISYTFECGGNTLDAVEHPCSAGLSVKIATLFPGATGDVHVTISNKIGGSLRLIRKITIGANGKTGLFTTPQAAVYYSSLTPVKTVSLPDGFDDYKVVVYNPCGNTYKIYNKKKERTGLWYKPFTVKENGHGVLFLIENFNVLKYDVTLTNSFTTRFTDVPDLFTSVTSMIGAGATPSADETTLVAELAKVLQMNTDLKRVLDADCIDFEQTKQGIRDNALLNFGPGGIVSIDGNYNSAKTAVITAKQTNVANPQPKYAAADFNAEYQKGLHLPLSPDSIVSETKNLYSLILSTRFRYQSNIVQLQNADEINYTLTIAGKTNTKNTTININAKPLTIPVLGGVKFDFSSGLYYSNVKNQTFALRKNATDATLNDVVDEGNNTGRTLGIAAFMHFYPRLLTGLNPSLTLGLGKSLDLNYSILVGPSILIGRQNHFVFSGGWNFANIKMLSNAYLDKNGQRIPQPVAATSVSTYNHFKTGAFLSFSYAFGGTAAKTQTAAASTDNSTATTAVAATTTTATTGKTKGKN